MAMPSLPRLFSAQECALFAVTAFWGTTFLVVRLAMQESGPLWFVGLRFGTAALAACLCSLGVLRGMTRREFLGGAAIGAFLFLGFVLQTAALAGIPASKSAFITAFYVPLVPLLEMAVMRRMPGRAAWAGIALAFPGVMLLSGMDGLSGGIGAGELMTMLCAVAFAMEIICTGMAVRDADPRRIAVVELAVTAFLSFAFMPVMGEAPAPFSWVVVGSACGLGIASAVIQSVIAWAQTSIPPTRATVIYTGEPVWGGITGYIAGERLPAMALLGCACVVAGILVSCRREK
ncbi:MAG: DMT family transporter [Mailhella sp.]|nr:DMT family transporter [Mailhella sp.]